MTDLNEQLSQFIARRKAIVAQTLDKGGAQAEALLKSYGAPSSVDALVSGGQQGVLHGFADDMERAERGDGVAKKHVMAKAARPMEYEIATLLGTMASAGGLRLGLGGLGRAFSADARSGARASTAAGGATIAARHGDKAKRIGKMFTTMGMKPNHRGTVMDAGHGALWGYGGSDVRADEEAFSPERLARAGMGAGASTILAPLATSGAVAAGNLPLALGGRRAFSQKMLEPQGVVTKGQAFWDRVLRRKDPRPANPAGRPRDAIDITRSQDETAARGDVDIFTGKSRSPGIIARDTAPPLQSGAPKIQKLADQALAPVAPARIDALRRQERNMSADAIEAAYPDPALAATRPAAPVSELPEQMRLASARLKDGSTQDVVADVFTDRGVVVVSPSWPTNAGNDLLDALVGRSNELRSPRKGLKVVDDNYTPPTPREPSPAWSSQNPQEMSDLTRQVADRFLGLSRKGEAHVLALTDEVDANSLATYIEANIPGSKALLATRDGGEVAIVDKFWLRDNQQRFPEQTWQRLFPSYNQQKGLRPQPADWAKATAAPEASPSTVAPFGGAPRAPEQEADTFVQQMMEAFTRQDRPALESWVSTLEAAARKNPAVMPQVKASVARQLAINERANPELNNTPVMREFLTALGLWGNKAKGTPNILESARAPAREAFPTGRYEDALSRTQGETPMRPRHADRMRQEMETYQPGPYTGPADSRRGPPTVARGDDTPHWLNPVDFFKDGKINDMQVNAAGVISGPLAYEAENLGIGPFMDFMVGSPDHIKTPQQPPAGMLADIPPEAATMPEDEPPLLPEPIQPPARLQPQPPQRQAAAPRGDDQVIRDIQQVMIDAGFAVGGRDGQPDGIVGPLTQRAIDAFTMGANLDLEDVLRRIRNYPRDRLARILAE